MTQSSSPAADPEIPLVALVVSAGLAFLAFRTGHDYGWCLTVPLVGLAAYLWPRWAALMPLPGVALGAALYALARQFGAPPSPLAGAVTTYFFLAYSLVFALWPGLRLRRELDATAARMLHEQGVLEKMASLTQLALRTDLQVRGAAAHALHLVRPHLPFTAALLLSGTREAPQPPVLLEPAADDPDWALVPALCSSAAFWEAHRAHTPTYVNEAAWPLGGPLGRGALAVLPLHLPGGPPTSLVVRRAGRGALWGVHDRQLLQAAAHTLRLIADQQQHLHALEYSARHDALTGCLNRRAFTQAIGQRRGQYVLALTDLDGFKALNDREGHARGDEALRLFARVLGEQFPADAVYRLGGDEFAVLLDAPPVAHSAPAAAGPHTSSPQDADPQNADPCADFGALLGEVVRRAAQIPGRLKELGLELAGVSIGAAHACEAAEPAEVLALADRRMYLMKHQRRTERTGWSAADPRAGTDASASPLDQALQMLGVVLEARDIETHGHSQRVMHLAQLLGQRMGLSAADLAALRQGAYLHDLGKLVVPDRVLLKPGPLNAEEWRLMQNHVQAGHQLASSLGFLEAQALTVIRSHHERWDGQGYPDRLVGRDIPELARIYSVVDVFDALTSQRPYKEAWPVERALHELQVQSGRQFDPAVVTAFLHLWNAQQRTALLEQLPLGGSGRLFH